MRRLILAAALILGAGLAVPIATVTQAQAINCSYGDNFYEFVADYPAQSTVIDSNGFMADINGGSGYRWCQVYTGMPGFTEWVLKSTSLCLQLSKDNGYRNVIATCDSSKASQEWGLVDNLGGENWGGVQSAYTNYGFRYMYLGVNCCNTEVSDSTGWDGSLAWNWLLYGPFR